MGDPALWIPHVDVFLDSESSEEKQTASRNVILKELRDGTITLQQLVIAEGRYLTSTDNTTRARGLLLLAELLNDLADFPLEDTAIHSLAAYFADRLQDWHCLRPALMGSIALLQRLRQVGALRNHDVEKICKSFIQEVDVQVLSLKDRWLSFQLYECLLFSHGSSVQRLGYEIAQAIIPSIDGEKDPRNILLAFRLVKQLIVLFPDPNGPLNGTIEDIFFVLSCYFPISYTPPKNSKEITREQLSSKLLEVFAATPKFAPLCFPEFLEKLSSDVQQAKSDALKYIGLCALSYGPEVTSQFSRDVWSGLKSELFRLEDGDRNLKQTDAQIREEAYLCLTRCVESSEGGRTLLAEPGDFLKVLFVDEDVSRYFESVQRNANLQRNDVSLGARSDPNARAIARILGSVAKAAPTACYFVAKQYFLPFLRLITGTDMSSGSAPVDCVNFSEIREMSKTVIPPSCFEGTLSVLSGAKLVAQSCTNALNCSFEESASSKWLEPITMVAAFLVQGFCAVVARDSMAESVKLGGCYYALRLVDVQEEMAGLQTLATFPAPFSLLSEDQLESVLDFLLVTYLDRDDNEVKKEALGAIIILSDVEESNFAAPYLQRGTRKSKAIVLNVIVPKLIRLVLEAEDFQRFKLLLGPLAELSKSRESVRLKVLQSLGEYAVKMLGQVLISSDHGFGYGKVVEILRTLSRYIVPFCKIGGPDQLSACDLVTQVWETVEVLLPPELDARIDSDLFLLLTAIIRVTIERCPEKMQIKFLEMSLASLQKRAMTQLPGGESLSLPSLEITGRGWFVALVASVVVGLLPTIVYSEREILLRLFVTTSIAVQNRLITDVAAQATASLLNKWQERTPTVEVVENLTLDQAISIALDGGWMPVINSWFEGGGSLEAFPLTGELAVRSVYGLAVVMKGLAMRGHVRTSDIVGLMLRILQREGMPTANGTSSLKDRSHDLLSTQSPVGKATVESFGTVVKEHSSFLSKNQNAVVKPLYQQRFFVSMLPPLLEAIRVVGNQPSRIWFHRAFASLLSGIPVAAYLIEGKKVFLLVLDGLSTLCFDSEDTDYLHTTLLALSSFLVDDQHGGAIAAEFVSSIVSRLTPLAQFKSSVCLASIVGLPYTRVYPVKSQVIKVVTQALDDNKRLIRKEAIRCRQVWSVVSSK